MRMVSVGNDDSNYKRLEDQKWRESVSTRLVSLTGSEVTQNDRLDEIDEEFRQVKEILEGKATDRNDTGLKGDIDEIMSRLRRIDAILWPDSTGNAGMVSNVTKLMKREGREERRAERWWNGLTPIFVAVVTSVGLILTNLDRIVPPLKKLFETHVETSIKPKKFSGRTSRKKQRQTHVIAAPTEATHDGSAEQEVPDRRNGNGGDSE